MLLIIDNYDSFTYNLYQYLSELGAQVETVRNDKTTLEEIEGMAAVIPALVSAAPVLANEVILGEFVTEVVFDSSAAAHEGAPQSLLAHLVLGVNFLARVVDTFEALVAQVGRLPVGG